MNAMPDLAETRAIASLLVALTGQTARQISHCAEQCGLSMVQASALLQIDGSMSMRELAARLGGHASNATGSRTVSPPAASSSARRTRATGG